MRNQYFLLSVALLIFACTSAPDADSLKLDNGKKWKVNTEMTPHIEKGHEILTAFVTQGSTDYKLLAASLKNQNDSLIRSCTMQGESHDQLHQWLHPHMSMINDLSKAENGAEAQALVQELEQSFDKYQTYFE